MEKIDNKKIGLISIVIGAVLLLTAVPAAEMAMVSFETNLGTITGTGLSPISVAMIVVGVIFLAFGGYMMKK